MLWRSAAPDTAVCSSPPKCASRIYSGLQFRGRPSLLHGNLLSWRSYCRLTAKWSTHHQSRGISWCSSDSTDSIHCHFWTRAKAYNCPICGPDYHNHDNSHCCRTDSICSYRNSLRGRHNSDFICHCHQHIGRHKSENALVPFLPRAP